MSATVGLFWINRENTIDLSCLMDDLVYAKGSLLKYSSNIDRMFCFVCRMAKGEESWVSQELIGRMLFEGSVNTH